MQDAETAIEKKIFMTIVNDYQATMSAINRGRPLTQIAPRATVTKNFRDLADTLLQVETQAESTPPKEEKKWWKRKR
jgi:Flp pilus assembly CpaE family ATPase